MVNGPIMALLLRWTITDSKLYFMKEDIQKKIANLGSMKGQQDIRQAAKDIAEKGGASALMKASRSLNTFQKKDVIHAMMPSIKKEHLSDLLDLLESEAKPVHGREEATVHSGIIKELFDKISQLAGEDLFEGVSLIDQVEIIKRVKMIKNRK